MPHARLILVALPIHFLLAKIDDEVINLEWSSIEALFWPY